MNPYDLVLNELNDLIHRCNVTIRYFSDLADKNAVTLTPYIMERLIEAKAKFENARDEHIRD
jgi:ElaB/YqjD/DUF883 family membrane-anchored ribosome-binding protein